MTDALPIMVVITSEDCSACQNLHSSGDFNRDGPVNPRLSFYGSKWDAPFFWRLLSGDPEPNENSRPRFRVYELEVYKMRETSLNNVKSFTQFTLSDDGTGITRHSFFRSEPGKDAIVYLENDTPFAKGVKKEGSFTAMLTRLFPNGLRGLLRQFPTFMWVSPTEWRKGLDNNTYVPYAAVFGLEVGESSTERGKVYSIVGHDTNEKRRTPVLMANYIAANPSALNPPVTEAKAAAAEVKVVLPKEEKAVRKPVAQREETCALPRVRVIPLNNNSGYHRYA